MTPTTATGSNRVHLLGPGSETHLEPTGSTESTGVLEDPVDRDPVTTPPRRHRVHHYEPRPSTSPLVLIQRCPRADPPVPRPVRSVNDAPRVADPKDRVKHPERTRSDLGAGCLSQLTRGP